MEELVYPALMRPRLAARWNAIGVVLRANAGVDEADLAAFVCARVAGYKVPKTFELRDEPLPLSGAGKVQKHLLRMRQFDESTG